MEKIELKHFPGRFTDATGQLFRRNCVGMFLPLSFNYTAANGDRMYIVSANCQRYNLWESELKEKRADAKGQPVNRKKGN